MGMVTGLGGWTVKEIAIFLLALFMLVSGFLLHEHQKTIAVMRTTMEIQQRQLKASAMRIDRNEYILGELGYNDELLADEIISRCDTKQPRPPLRLKGR
jgi:hypothetical protein